jgi:hypothetical protein
MYAAHLFILKALAPTPADRPHPLAGRRETGPEVGAGTVAAPPAAPSRGPRITLRPPDREASAAVPSPAARNAP